MHTCKDDIQDWKDEWGEGMYASHGKTNLKGTSILFNRNFTCEVTREIYGEKGRYVILEIKHEGYTYMLGNYYGPNKDKTEWPLAFLKDIGKCSYTYIIVGGDLNFVMDVNMDREGGRLVTNDNCANIFKEWMAEEGVLDIWRIMNPEVKMFTWISNKKPHIFSRLDHFLISSSLVQNLVKTEISPGYRTDHMLMVYVDRIAQAAAMRAKCEYYEHGEKNNKFFLNQKCQAEKKSVK